MSGPIEGLSSFLSNLAQAKALFQQRAIVALLREGADQSKLDQEKEAPMCDDLIERLRNFTEEDAYAMPWTFGAVVREAADELARLRADVDRLKWERDLWREKMDHALKCERDARAALADEREHADALAEALEAIANLPAGKVEAVATAKRARHIAICARRQG